MVPDLDLQLQVVIKALSGTVMPALDPSQSVAIEQLGLSLATLAMVRARLPHAAAREWTALDNATALARAVAVAHTVPELDAAIAGAATLLDAPNPAPGARTEATQRLSALVSAVAADPATPAEVLRIIVAHSKPSLDLARAWCISAGFEPDPGEVPALEALLAARD